MSTVLGGYSETKDATEEIQKICDTVKCQVQEKTSKMYEEFKAIKYRSQTVAGVNYLIKVHVGGSSYLHLLVYQTLLHEGEECKLKSVEEIPCVDDPLVPF